MKRITIAADERTMERLRALARARGVPLAVIIREALAQKTAQYGPSPLSTIVRKKPPKPRQGASAVRALLDEREEGR